MKEPAMRTLLSLGLATLWTIATPAGQPSAANGVLGTWSGPAACLHGDGETFTMVITRDATGAFSATMDWALSRSDGTRGPGAPVTTVKVEDNRVTASHTRGARTIRLNATVKDGVMAGTWATEGDTDVWTFTGKRLPAVP
jgi:hypothetical protein